MNVFFFIHPLKYCISLKHGYRGVFLIQIRVELCDVLLESILILVKDFVRICGFSSIEIVCCTLYFKEIYLGFSQICWQESLRDLMLMREIGHNNSPNRP